MRNRLSVNVHIERLVLDGIDLAAGDQAALEAALTTELARLMGQAMARTVRAGRSMASLRAGSIDVDPGTKPADLGQQIARAVYAGMDR